MAALTGDALDGVTHLPVTYKGYFHTVILLKREISDPWRAIDVANLLNFSNFSNFLSLRQANHAQSYSQHGSE